MNILSVKETDLNMVSAPAVGEDSFSPVSGRFKGLNAEQVMDPQAHISESQQRTEACQAAPQKEFISGGKAKGWCVSKYNEECSVEIKYLEKHFKDESKVFSSSPKILVPTKEGGEFGVLFDMDKDKNEIKLSPYVKFYTASMKPDSDCLQPNMESLDIPKDRIAFFDNLTMDVSLLDSAGNKISDIDLHTFHFAGEDQEDENELDLDETHCGNTYLWNSSDSVGSVNCLFNPTSYHRRRGEPESAYENFHEVKVRLDKATTKAAIEKSISTENELAKLDSDDKGGREKIVQTAEEVHAGKFKEGGEFYSLVQAKKTLKTAYEIIFEQEVNSCKVCTKYSTVRPLYEQWTRQISNSSDDYKDLRIKVEFKSSKKTIK